MAEAKSRAMKVVRWGDSLAVRLSPEIAERAGLEEGCEIEISIEDGVLTLRPAPDRYDLDSLLALMTPDNLHEETDWGTPEGREIW